MNTDDPSKLRRGTLKTTGTYQQTCCLQTIAE